MYVPVYRIGCLKHNGHLDNNLTKAFTICGALPFTLSFTDAEI